MPNTAGPGRLPRTSQDRPGELDAESRVWVTELGADGARRERARADLLTLLARAARAEVDRRAPRTSLTGPELEGLARGAARDALATITADPGRFDGRSRFTTWACAFVVANVSSGLGRSWATRPPASPTGGGWTRLAERLGAAPEADQPDPVSALQRAVDSVLTAHQGRVFTAVLVDGVPMDAVAALTGTSRDAVHRTLCDARRELLTHLFATPHQWPPRPRRYPQPSARHHPPDEEQSECWNA